MRDTLADASLARYAGQFVWLELDFDHTENQEFLAKHAVLSTPSFFIINPMDEEVVATQMTAMTLSELAAFFERGALAISAKKKAPADAAFARGDTLLAGNNRAEAVTAFREALRLGGSIWPQRGEAIGSLTWALKSDQQWQPCAETAATEAPVMGRSASFGKVVLSGLMCVYRGWPEAWAVSAAKVLEPLAEEAVTLSTTVRDHRFELYQNLMALADARGDKTRVAKWGDRWLRELDTTKPANDDERSALDIARVDVESILGDPFRILPALAASERAMPNNYNASLRFAQMEIVAKHFDAAIAACDRGLSRAPGPLGRSWLLQTKTDALLQKGDPVQARRALEEALRAAEAIPADQLRSNNVARIQARLSAMKDPAKKP